MKNLFFVGILLLLVGSACKKEEDNWNGQNGSCPYPSGCTTFEIISTDLLDCFYKTGTYWVYVDSVNLAIDSVAIISFDTGSIYTNSNANTYEHHSFSTLTYPAIDTLNYRVMPWGIMKEFDEYVFSGTSVYESIFNLNSFEPSAVILDSIFIYDQNYYDVVRIEIANDPTEASNQSFYYTNAEFGFLRHDVYSGAALISKKVLMNKNIVR
ncbi:MAG: hypothetical protein QNK23_08460 [Crocinitomicaceae bacterium]|nr:hypothetical protein [Crocinitomicaceae bacterium]